MVVPLLVLLLVADGPGSATAATPTQSDRRVIGESERSRHEEVRLVDAAGTVREIHVRAPRGVPCPLPAVLLLAGFESGRAALDLVDERDDLVLVSMDYPYRGPQDPSGLGWLTAVPALRRMAHETLEAGSLVLDTCRTIPPWTPSTWCCSA